MEELDKFNQDHEKDKSKLKLIVEDLPTGDYGYDGKTISEFEVKTKKRKVLVYRKEADTEGKLF
jgi:hypothetical protein